MSMFTRCVRCNRVFRTSTWLLTSVLRVRAIIHRPKGFRRVLPDQRKRFCRVVPRWNTVITRNRQEIVEVNRKKRDRGGREREEGRVRGLTLNLETLRADEPPQGYLKDDGARRRFLILAFRRPETLGSRVFLFENGIFCSSEFPWIFL